MSESLLKYEFVKKGLFINKKYNLCEYVELNFNKFNDNGQNEMEKLLNFYDKNTSLFLNKTAILNSQERNELL